MMTSRQDGRLCLNRILSDWHNNSSNTELNLNNILSTLCNQCELSDHKGNDCLHKNKICNYYKKEKHFQKICFKKQYNNKVNDVTTNKKDDSNYAFMNTFITSEKSHKNQLTRHDSGRICSLQKSHYISMIIIDSEAICHAFYDRIMFKLIEPIMQNTFVINESPLSVQR